MHHFKTKIVWCNTDWCGVTLDVVYNRVWCNTDWCGVTLGVVYDRVWCNTDWCGVSLVRCVIGFSIT